MATIFIVGLVMVGLGALCFVGSAIVASVYKSMEKEMKSGWLLIPWWVGVVLIIVGGVICYHYAPLR